MEVKLNGRDVSNLHPCHKADTEFNPRLFIRVKLFLPPCRGKVRMGGRTVEYSVSTPSLALPLPSPPPAWGRVCCG
jgi:hypothetical protein